MTTDLWMLATAVGLTWLMIMVAATPGILRNGLRWSLGNREEAPEPTGAHRRAVRLAANMLENLPLFAALVLIAHVSETANAQTALGSQIFIGGRVAHAICYWSGIPVARTITWAVSIAGMFMIAAAFFG